MLFPKKQKTLPKSNRQKTGQKEVFAGIWNERPHYCIVCGKYIPEPLSFCFAHVKSKGVHPELKFNKENIELVCSIDCHRKMDSLNSIKGLK